VLVAVGEPERLPLADFDPVQAPLALHEVAFVDDQVSVEDSPLLMVEGFAEIETVGAGVDTVTVTDLLAEPPAPVQVSVYVVVAASAPVDWFPLVALLPVQPPVALQEVALAEDQARVEDAPLDTEPGLAVRVTEGTGLDVTVTVTDLLALPPGPVQVSV
jgi:hypothetical protein